MLCELASNSEVQNALRSELLATRDVPYAGPLDDRFPILDAVYKETLRVHPPVIELHHVAKSTTYVPTSHALPSHSEARIVVPKGTIISIPVAAIHTDQKIWGEDASTWDPVRWLRDDYGAKGQHLLAFSSGYGFRRRLR